MEGHEWLRSQLTAFNCSSCGRAYVGSRIRVLAQRDDHWFVSLKCVACGSGALGLVTIRDAPHGVARGEHRRAAPVGGRSGPTFSGEFTASDVLRLATADPVDADDVIQTHDFLQLFDGDFHRLFAGGEGR